MRMRPEVIAVCVDAFPRQRREQRGALAGNQAVNGEFYHASGRAEDSALAQAAGHLWQDRILDYRRLGANQDIFAAGCVAQTATVRQGDEQAIERVGETRIPHAPSPTQ